MSLTPKQTTIAKAAETISGRGLFHGEPVTVRMLPAPADSGIVFARIDLPGAPEIPAVADSLGRIDRRTTLRCGEAEVLTVEHVLASLVGLGIDNLRIEVDAAEMPALDGSALPFAEALKDARVVELDRPARCFTPGSPVVVEDGDMRIEALPGDGGSLKIEYVLDYPGTPLGRHEIACEVTPETFLEEIAPARTFCLQAEAEAMQAAGLGGGASYDNALIIGPDGPINNAYRLEDEPARHKVLDLLGDLALLGGRLSGRLRAVRSGHALNTELVKELSRQMAKDEEQATDVKLDIREIMRILPHRYPFLLVDRVIEIEGYKRAVGIKNVTMNEHFFQGHFPGRPMMPGVLQVEAMAQLAGVLLLRKIGDESKLAVLMGLDKVRFPRPVVPGDQLVLEAVAKRVGSRAGTIECKASVDGEKVAEALIKFFIINYDENASQNTQSSEDTADAQD